MIEVILVVAVALMGFLLGSDRERVRAERRMSQAMETTRGTLREQEAYYRAKVDSLMQTILDMKQAGYAHAPLNDEEAVYRIDNAYELEVEAKRRKAQDDPLIPIPEDPYGIHLPMSLTDG